MKNGLLFSAKTPISLQLDPVQADRGFIGCTCLIYARKALLK
jgi:hypothetical protein